MKNKIIVAMILVFVGTFLFSCRNVYAEDKEVEVEIKTEDLWTDVYVESTTGFKSYMSYKSLTKSDLPQAKLQKVCSTDENGLRVCAGRYVIAVGSGVGGRVGDCVDVILKNGVSIQCVIGDYKDDKHTDESNLVGKANGCCSEFIVDTSELRDDVKARGNISLMNDSWNSPVVKIRRYIYNCLGGN